MSTDRYIAFEPFLKKRITFTGKFSKKGTNNSRLSSKTCLSDITISGRVIYDHLWIDNEELAALQMNIGDLIEVTTTFKKRKRASISIFLPPIEDIQVSPEKTVVRKLPKTNKKGLKCHNKSKNL